MSELKFENIKVGDRIYDFSDSETGTVTRKVDSYLHIEWPTHHDVKYSIAQFDWYLVEKTPNPVTAPPHYNLPNGLQVIDLTKNESFLRGNVLKYVFRAPHKGNELEDLLKARQYLNWEIERVEKESK
jgi:hypothetical protein